MTYDNFKLCASCHSYHYAHVQLYFALIAISYEVITITRIVAKLAHKLPAPRENVSLY